MGFITKEKADEAYRKGSPVLTDEPKFIALADGRFTVVSAQDHDKVKDYLWCTSGNGYVMNSELGNLHTFLLETDKVVDHKNRDKLDNRKVNLREVSKSENATNASRDMESIQLTDNGYEVWFGNKKLGLRKNKSNAEKLYIEHHLELYGEFSKYYNHSVCRAPTDMELGDAIDHRNNLLEKSKKEKYEKMKKPIYNSKGERFESIEEASIAYNISKSTISGAKNQSQQKTSAGLIWFDKDGIDEAYRQGKPLIEDSLYDSLFGINASDMDTIGSSDLKIKHEKFMPSLKKVKVASNDGLDFSEVADWFSDIPTASPIIVGTWKYDGLACELVYEDGKLVTASTRGDGEYGEDITSNVLKMHNVSKEITGFTGRLMGEIIITHDHFNKYLEETNDKNPMDNPRNGASGATRRKDGKNAKYCSLKYYGIDQYMPLSDIAQYELIEDYKLDVVPYEILTDLLSIKEFYNSMMDKRGGVGYEVDGLVLSVDDDGLKEQLGFHSNKRPKYKVALKFPVQSKQTELLDIQWQIGKTGKITPVGIVAEVDLGVKVNRVSLANLNKMKEKKINIGDTLVISRRGDVIPHVEENLTPLDGYVLTFPTNCKACGTETIIDGAFLRCPNDECPGRSLGNIEKWIRVIKDCFRIHCIGPERLRELHQGGYIESVADLYRLTTTVLINDLEGIGEKSASNMLTYKAYKDIPLHTFMGALNIAEIGSSVWKMLIDNTRYNTIEELLSIDNWMDIYQRNVEGIGETRAMKMADGIKAKRELIQDLLSEGINPQQEKSIIEDSPITGKSFVITGSLSRGRPEFEGIIKKKGGVVKKSVSKKVDFLIAGANVGATKTNKAKDCGTTVISESEFWAMTEE